MSEAADIAYEPGELQAHSEWLRRLAAALVRDADEADDLAQQALEVALTRPPRRAGPLRPWLAGVVRNLARSGRRQQARRARREELAGQGTDPVPSAEVLLERARLSQLVVRAVTELGEPYRSTVLLRFYEGLSSAEIARRLGVPAGTVRWRLARGLEQIRAALDRDGPRRWPALLVPLAGSDAVPVTSVAMGALLVKTAVKIAAVALILLATVYLGGRQLEWWGANSGAAAPEPEAAPSPASAASPRSPTYSAGSGLSVAGAFNEADPLGDLRLEGQVIDENELPVGGARVVIDSHPPRTARSEADGSFAFDGLIGRDYTLAAATDEHTAGPVHIRLSATSEPVILRIHPASPLEVTVVASESGEPIAGAEVELRGLLTRRAVTGAEGRARLAWVDRPEPVLRVAAEGFAPMSMRLIARPAGDVRRERIALRRGAPVSGQVSAGGEPVAGARVVAVPTSEPYPVIDHGRDGALTDAEGRWHLPVLAAGTYRFVASSPGYAPAESAPIALDGRSERTGVDLELAAGATISGTVTAPDGEPVAGADVRVVAAGSLPWRPVRRAYTGASGRFRLEGLRRLPVDVVASHERGSSEIVRVDLDRRPDAQVALALSVSGAIAGTVIGPGGEPQPEAQIVAEPEWTGTRGEREPWDARGTQFRVADAGGRFHFTGLPEGRYRLRAARPGAGSALWLDPGVLAATGETGVILELRAPGTVRGVVQLEGGEPPGPFTVGLGRAQPVAFAGADGRFEIEAPGGPQTLHIAGPAFVPESVEVTVEGGETADAGTITVVPGRSVSGRVVDASGNPVSGAEVAAGLLLTGDGSKLYIPDESIQARVTTTGEDGRFVLAGFADHRLTVVAGKEGVGRSPSLDLGTGERSVEVELALEPTASLAGRVRRDGSPVAGTVVIANPIGATLSNFFVVTGSDGRFALDALSPGTYTVIALLAGGGARPIELAEVAVGARAEIELVIRSGDSTLEIVVETEAGEPVPVAQVFAVDADIDIESAAELRRSAWLARLPERDASAAIWKRRFMGQPAEIARIRPGRYTVCAIPLPIDPRDPAAFQAIQRRMNELPIRCVPFELAAAPRVQRAVVRVPAAWTRPAP